MSALAVRCPNVSRVSRSGGFLELPDGGAILGHASSFPFGVASSSCEVGPAEGGPVAGRL